MDVVDAIRPASLDIEELADSAPLLGDHDALRARWEADGVLFFRGVIAPAAIAALRDEYMARLKEMAVVDPEATESIWNGTNKLDGSKARPVADDSWRRLVADPSFDAVVRNFLGEAPTWMPIVVHRAAPPLSAAAPVPEVFGARHQDGVYNYGIDFITCWVPLMDIDDEVGGLAVVPGSHRGSLYPPDAFAVPGRRIGIPADAIPDSAWRRPDYKAGDLLMFHSMTAHAGVPNRSNKMRLSVDIRFLPASAAPVVGRVVSASDAAVTLKAEAGDQAAFEIDPLTIVRGPKGHAVVGEERDGILFPDAEIIVVPDERGHAKLIRSVSRKYVDLPATWYETLPADWVR